MKRFLAFITALALSCAADAQSIGGGVEGGTPAIGSITGLGTGVATALGANVGSAGAFVTFNGALGTPSSGVATNITGLPLGTGVTGTLLAGQFPALTGDLTTTAGSLATTLATVNANVGSFGSATQAGTFTVNAKGLVTAAGNVTVTPAIGSVTGLGTSVATALGINVGSAGALVTNGGALGTPSSGTGTNITGIPSGNITGLTGAATATFNNATSWTPNDQSGASLSFTNVNATYTRLGDTINIWLHLTYPTTADGSAAHIGNLPVTVANQSYNLAPGACFGQGGITTAIEIIPDLGTTHFSLVNGVTQVNYTNANLSTFTLSCRLSYSAS